MYWLPFAFLTAISLSTADALSKRALKNTDGLVVVWVREGYALPFLSLGFIFVPIPDLDKTFWLSVAGLVPLEIVALLMYIKAIKLSPLSLTVPFMALSPIFIILIAFVFLGEWPSRAGIVGIFFIAAGAYMLNASASSTGFLGPLKAVLKEPGSILMVGVAMIYSLTATLGKVAVTHSSPIFFGFFYPFTLTLVLTAFVIARGKFRLVFSKPATFLPIGLCTATMMFAHFIAISLTQVAYMISVKRTSLLFSVLYGKILFNEVNIRERLLGSAIMLLGVFLIILF
ncbi:MAG: DMT family transporter [Deltaproteobacteria bacterium]|nr:DMT family transporter [Deltaproteobacteria bacterium]